MTKKNFSDKILKNILSAVAIAGFGMLMLYIVIIFYAFLLQAVSAIIFLSGTAGKSDWFFPLAHLSYLAIVGAVSWLVLRSRMRTLYKAIYLPVPVVVVSFAIGMFFFSWPAAVYALNALFYAGVIHYFAKTGKPWQYFYAVILVALGLVVLLATGGEI